jgi:hypothetical protein
MISRALVRRRGDFPGEVLAFQNIERQAHALRAQRFRAGVVQPPAGTPDFGEDDFEALPTRGSAPPDLVRTISRPRPTRGATPLSFYCPAERDAVVLLPASPDLRPSRRSGSAPPISLR